MSLKLSALGIFILTLLIFSSTGAFAYESFGVSSGCQQQIDSHRIKVAYDQLSAPSMVELEDLKNDISLIGKKVAVQGLKLDDGNSGEVRIDTDAIQKGLLLGCDGTEGIVESYDSNEITLRTADGSSTTIYYVDLNSYPRNDIIYVQVLPS